MELTSIQMRILNKIKDLNQYDLHPGKDLICEKLIDFHNQSKTKKEILNLIDNTFLTENNGLYIADTFDWLEFLRNKNVEHILVLGLPGVHAKQFISKLDEKKILYIDHDVAWKSLMRNAINNISIISPFADKKGFDFFGNYLIDAVKKNIDVEIITRSLKRTNKKNPRLLAFSNFYRHFCDELKNREINIYQFYDGTNEEEFHSHLGSVHAKLLIQDSKMAYIGSGEFRGNSIFKNIEIGYITSNESQVVNLKGIFDITKSMSIKTDWSLFQ